jgi:Na+/H+ antiporter NhaA
MPALLFTVISPGGPASAGWGIPMATDVAFAVGVLVVLGSRVPADARLLLLGIAIVDDLLAIVVITVFYSASPAWAWLAAAVAGLLALLLMRGLGVTRIWPYALTGLLVAGKTIGIATVTLAAVRARLGVLPAGVTTSHVWGLSLVAGIGFTVSLFITGPAYQAPGLADQAKVGIFAGSLASGIAGAIVLVRSHRAGTALRGDAALRTGIRTRVQTNGRHFPHALRGRRKGEGPCSRWRLPLKGYLRAAEDCAGVSCPPGGRRGGGR